MSILYLLTSFAISVVSVPIFMKLAERLGIVDRPDGALKTYSRPTPYLGGLGILLGTVPALWGDVYALSLVWIASLLGLTDDVYDLNPKLRFTIEVVLSIGIVYRYVGFENWWYSLMLVVAFTALINAVNMVDGMDGVCAGSVAISATFFALLSPNPFTTTLALSIVGSSLGYLVYNFPPAKVFMGDAGSYSLGMGLAILYASAVRGPDPNRYSIVLVFPLWMYGLDLVAGIFRRLRAGRSPFQGDKDHFYDKINRRVKSVRKTLIFVYSMVGSFSVLSVPCRLSISGCVFSTVVAFVLSYSAIKLLNLFGYD